jgi:hypothetical protein
MLKNNKLQIRYTNILINITSKIIYYSPIYYIGYIGYILYILYTPNLLNIDT